jgi:type II restriction/modification system DNA methylase subunit YeeA
MQTTLSFRTNRDLFSNHYLDEHLPETEAWEKVAEAELQEAREEILELWNREKDTAPQRNESQLEEKFIRPMFRKLGIPFEVEEKTSRTQRVPDYGFFESEEAARKAFDRREEGGNFYEDAVAVADAKRWGRPLDTRGSGEHRRDFENPSYQIHYYLQETPARWAVLTDGRKWRLYYGPTSHRLDSYYEVDLPTVLEEGDLEDFKYFYHFFRHEAFLEDVGGGSFLDDVYEESNVFARELGEDLQDNIYNAIEVLAEGFLSYPENDLSEVDLDLIHDSALIYLYRVIFVLYAEAEGRELLDTDNEIYENSFSLNALKQDLAEELDSPDPRYRDWQDDLWDRLDELFKLIDRGSEARGIPEDDLSVPAYNGGLFRTAPDADDSPEAQFLAEYAVGDAHLAEVIDLLTRSRNGGGRTFVDYSSLDVRHLGSIYEGLLEYQLNVADEPLALDDGEYVPADEDVEVEVGADEVYLTTDSGERKATGSYYTPEYVVEYIVENTLEPLVTEIREDLAGQSARDEGGFAAEFAERVFELKVLDPAMGSGHFLTNAVDFLAREIIDAQERQAAQEGIETVDEDRDINWARRQVAQRCIYGVDLNPLATELAKVSLWLRTLAAEQPLAFLDHHLKTGNSLVGSDIEDVLENGSGEDEVDEGQLTLVESFDRTRRQALDHVTDRFQALLAIDNETLADIKEMEAVFDEVRDDPLYRHLLAMANVHTADAFGLDVPSDAYDRMAAALRDDAWDEVEAQDWFRSAQAMAEEERFFHWELEFPVAFYGEDGERDEDAGFDAVIGNPPYVRMEEFKQMKYYLESEYETHASRTDLYVYFIEASIGLLGGGSEYGAIVSNKFLRANYGKPVRTLLGTTNIREIVDFGGLPVFPDATVRSAIILTENEQPSQELIRYTSVDNLDFDILSNVVSEQGFEIESKNLKGEKWRLVRHEVSEIMDTIESVGVPLIDYKDEFVIGRGIVTGLNEAFFIDDAVRKELIGKDPKSAEVIKPLTRGENIRPYHIHQDESYILYMNHGVDIAQYPAVRNYLVQFRERLDDRATEQAWYELQQPQEAYIDYFDGPKIVYPEIAPETRFAFHPGPLYPNNKCFFIPTTDRHIVAVFNSKLSQFYLQQILAKLEGTTGDDVYYEFRSQFMEQFPIVPFDDRANRESKRRIFDLVKNLEDFYNEHTSLNLNPLDYLGNYAEGPNLPDIGLFQPTSTNRLDSTTENNEKLRIGEVRTERDGSSVTIQATARYKPEDEDEHETDRWGYTETDYLEAFTLADLSETEAALIEAFVPVAVEESDGFAGFRDNATKTTSLVDRLKAITLPDPDDVEDDLRRYVEAKERAEDLDEKIEQTDQLIDEIVYELYGLTDEEIEIVEQSIKGT